MGMWRPGCRAVVPRLWPVNRGHGQVVPWLSAERGLSNAVQAHVATAVTVSIPS